LRGIKAVPDQIVNLLMLWRDDLDAMTRLVESGLTSRSV
jgi:hypothetical protein